MCNNYTYTCIYISSTCTQYTIYSIYIYEPIYIYIYIYIYIHIQYTYTVYCMLLSSPIPTLCLSLFYHSLSVSLCFVCVVLCVHRSRYRLSMDPCEQLSLTYTCHTHRGPHGDTHVRPLHVYLTLISLSHTHTDHW